MAQQKQHRVIQMDIRLKLMKHYKNAFTETGIQIEYGLKKLREDPQETERWLTQRNTPPEITLETTAEEDWGWNKKTKTTSTPNNMPQEQQTKRKTNTRLGGKSKTMERAKGMGGNAATYWKKR